MSSVGVPFLVFLLLCGGLVLVVLSVMKVLEGVAWLINRVVRFVATEIGETIRFAGSLASAGVLLAPMALSVLSGNPSRVAHYGRSFRSEFFSAVKSLYRLALRNPLEFVGIGILVHKVEIGVGEAVRNAPIADVSGSSRGQFEGYRIVGSLPTGGSGAKLYVADPTPDKEREFAHAGLPPVGQVVIKSFAMGDGPSLPQIVRESRALDAARKLGLVLDHGLDERGFFYVMPYVPGENLSVVTDRMHADSGAGGLSTDRLRQGMSYVSDLLLTLERYHQGGLIHKDVKPDNIIVCGDRAYLVDLGLVTPLRSAMTLTTHGTEYFRDPELVRMAMKGAKVNEVDAVRFDLYGAGAVLFSIIEGSFPAHGGLSEVTKDCPEALKWIVRRAMAEMHGRYGSAREMLLDLHKVLEAAEPLALKPADLPSLGGAAPRFLPHEPAPLHEYRPRPRLVANRGPAPVAAAAAPPPPPPPATPVPGRQGGVARSLARGVLRAAMVVFIVGAVVAGVSGFYEWDRGRQWGGSVAHHLADRTSHAIERVGRIGDRILATGPGVTISIQDIDDDECWETESDELVRESLREDSWPNFDEESVFVMAQASRAVSGSYPTDPGVIVVVDDYSSATDRQGKGELAGVFAELRSEGFRLLGDDYDDDEGEREMALVAMARNSIGMKVVDEAHRSLSKYLLKQQDVEAVIWLREAEDGDVCCSVIANPTRYGDQLERILDLN